MAKLFANSGDPDQIPSRKMAKLFANSGDPDQMLHSAASDLGLHCLPVTLLWVSRLQWIRVCTSPSTTEPPVVHSEDNF